LSGKNRCEKEGENAFLPFEAVIKDVRDINRRGDTKLFTLAVPDGVAEKIGGEFCYRPGQFVEVSVFGFEEAPISIASSPHPSLMEKNTFEMCIRSVGSLTAEVHRKKPGDTLQIRGPYGRCFPLLEHAGRDLLFVAGGIGLAPIRGVIKEAVEVEEIRQRFGKIHVLYGARTPSDMVFVEDLERWKKMDASVLTTVDRAESGWDGNVGVVGSLLDRIDLDVKNTVAYVSGPPIMLRFVIKDLCKMGVPENQIITTLERRMRCGIGKCGHCMMGPVYTCMDGPVFTYAEIKNIPEAL